MMRNTLAVFKNQFNEFIADKEQLMLFVLFPGLAFFQARIADLDEGVYPYQIAIVFAAMFASTVMVMLIPPIVAEHRENGSLRFMVMSGIKPLSYLSGIGGFFIILNLLVGFYFAWLGAFSGVALVNFLLGVLLGVICSILIGAVIGILSKNRQKAMGFSMPIGMGLAFLPIFATSLEALQPIMNVLYLDRIANIMAAGDLAYVMNDIWVVLANVAVLVVIFAGLFKLKGLKG